MGRRASPEYRLLTVGTDYIRWNFQAASLKDAAWKVVRRFGLDNGDDFCIGHRQGQTYFEYRLWWRDQILRPHVVATMFLPNDRKKRKK